MIHLINDHAHPFIKLSYYLKVEEELKETVLDLVVARVEVEKGEQEVQEVEVVLVLDLLEFEHLGMGVYCC